jgi:hypothetical protein
MGDQGSGKTGVKTNPTFNRLLQASPYYPAIVFCSHLQRRYFVVKIKNVFPGDKMVLGMQIILN